MVDNPISPRYNGEVIPSFDSFGNLPPGIHSATMSEVKNRFTDGLKRQKLFGALKKLVAILCEAQCPEIHLDGSFITKEEEPGDYDLCYEPTGMQPTEAFRRLLVNPENLKSEYLGDIFIRMPEPPYFTDQVKNWQKDGRNNDVIKGILKIDLRAENDAQE